jgi:energy-coupling factor transporter ATP-binding protein EcfA2
MSETPRPSRDVEPPVVPKTLDELRVPWAVLESLILKTLYVGGTPTFDSLSDILKIPSPLVRELAERTNAWAPLVQLEQNRISLTELGRTRARDAFDESRYIGPVPVSLEAYLVQCERQSLRDLVISTDDVRQALSDLLVRPETIDALAAAVCLGRSLLLTGPPGSGKSSIARRLGSLVLQRGGAIFCPHSLLIDRSILRVFDPELHHRVLFEVSCDPRWVPIRRPVAFGPVREIQSSLQWPTFNGRADSSSVPIQIKANGGTLLFDRIRSNTAPELLERCEELFETARDSVLLPEGRRLVVPADAWLLAVADVAEAWELQHARWGSQVELSHPTREEFHEVFRRECLRQNLPINDAARDFAWSCPRRPQSQPVLRDPQDLLCAVRAICRCRGMDGVALTPELLRLGARQLGWQAPPETEAQRQCA